MADSNILSQAKITWANGAHNNSLCKLAGVYKRQGVTLEEAIADAQALYDSIDTPQERHLHHAEVERAFSKVYNSTFTRAYSKKSPKGQVSYKECQATWRKPENGDTALKRAILASDVSETRIKTKQALRAIFAHVDGRISQGNSVEDKSWCSTTDDFRDLKTTAKYVTLCTFGGKVNADEQAEADARGCRKTCYERTNDNAIEIAGLLLEFDEPLGKEKIGKEEFAQLSEEERQKYRDEVLTDTCLVIEKAGLKPTTVTFSGNRSYHFVFRFPTPVTPEDFDKVVGSLKSIYPRIGADEATLTISRLTRMPRGCTRLEAQDGKCQRIMYLDNGAEHELEEIVEALEKVADEICKDTGTVAITMPIFEKPSKSGGTTWTFAPANWDAFCEDIGLKVVASHGDYNSPFLIVRKENGVYREVSPYLALDHCIRMIRRVNPVAGAWFRELRASKLKNACLEYCAGNVRDLKQPEDSSTTVYAPFRNGLLEITSLGVTLHDGYLGYDIPYDAPTILREYEQRYEKSEYETFLDHACGELEGNATLWKQRKSAIMTLIGYLVSRHKETVNWLCILTEETMSENMGRTGKSIIMKSIKYWRKRYFKDCKNMSVQNDRFKWSGLKSDTDYIQMDDLPKGYDIQSLFSLSTDELELEKKGKDFTTVRYEDVPKFVFGTNYFPKGEGDSFDGRMRIYEISNHYGASLTPEDEFKHRLFEGWTTEEWQRFDNFVVECVQLYLKEGLLPCPSTNVSEKRLSVNLPDEVSAWIEDGVVDSNHINVWRRKKYLPKEFSDWFVETYGKNVRAQSYSVKYLVAKIKDYASAKGLKVEEAQKRIDCVSDRCICVSNIHLMGCNPPKPTTTIDVSIESAPTPAPEQGEDQTDSVEPESFLNDAPDLTIGKAPF